MNGEETRMRAHHIFHSLPLLFVIILASCQPVFLPTQETKMSNDTSVFQAAFDMNARLGRGVNLGNALEAPKEGDWGVTLQAKYFRDIKAYGFQSVRVPIRWSAHAGADAPYTIDANFFKRIDWVVDQAEKNGLAVILNIHHYEELVKDPSGQRARFLAIWEQIASHYQAAPQTVLFELLNEPNGEAMPAEVWNELAAAALEKVRETNPNRFVVIGPVDWNNVNSLDSLRLPVEDPRIIATFHFYLPFHFTHQGAEWAEGSDQWLGTKWSGDHQEREALTNDFEKASSWSEKNHRPVLVGEFGAYNRADMDSRARWTEAVAREAEKRGFSWSYWEYCAGFGFYDPRQQTTLQPLLEALIPLN